jgi:hypothetical protein
MGAEAEILNSASCRTYGWIHGRKRLLRANELRELKRA